MISRVVRLSSCTLLLLLQTASPTDECIKEKCVKTLLIPAVEDWRIELQPCDVCTNCTTMNPQTVLAWWYYYWPNGSQTDGITAKVIDNRNYAINLLGHFSLVTLNGSHIIYTNYMYLCDGVPGVLQDIEITLTPVGATIQCQNEIPVSEGSSVVIWCETGLPDSRNMQTTFHFYGRRGECPHAVQKAFGHSSWMANRNENEPYTCGLYIQNMQLSDSGDYYCEVSIPSTNITVKSNSLHIEVVSPNPVKIPSVIAIPVASAGGLLILGLSVMLLACFVTRKCQKRPVDPDDPQVPLMHRNGAEIPQQGYGTSGSMDSAGGVRELTSSLTSDPNEMSGSFTDGGKQSETSNI